MVEAEGVWVSYFSVFEQRGGILCFEGPELFTALNDSDDRQPASCSAAEAEQWCTASQQE